MLSLNADVMQIPALGRKNSMWPRLLPGFVFGIMLVMGLAVAVMTYRSMEADNRERFAVLAGEIEHRVQARLREHVLLLRAVKALFEVHKGVPPREVFHRFVGSLDIAKLYDGLQGVGFAQRIATGDEALASTWIRDTHGIDRSIWPGTTDSVRMPIILLEPENERNRAALGYDMYSEVVRREAINAAIKTGEPTASGPVMLVQEITEEKQVGFLVYLPYRRDDGSVAGLVYAPFRSIDLLAAVLPQLEASPVVLDIADVSGPDAVELYSSGDMANGAYRLERTVRIAGRDWHFTFSATSRFGHTNSMLVAVLLALASLILAAALGLSAHAQRRAVATAEDLARANQKASNDKDLLLQEMKHRIKNAISRMLAIARHTAASSPSLETFIESYGARLQAMASAQDLLTRSHWERADLRMLVEKELQQVFGDALERATISGPDVDLDERQAQAFGLLVHELATNALKYGAGSSESGRLDVSWAITRQASVEVLVFSWREQGSHAVAEMGHAGFGSRLIDAMVRGELGGSIERHYLPEGLSLAATIPRRR